MKAAALRLVLIGAVGVLSGALEAFLDGQNDFDVVAVAGVIADVRVTPALAGVAVVILCCDSLEYVRWSQLVEMRENFPEAALMLLTRLDDTLAVEQAFREGVTSLVDIRTQPHLFLDAIRRTARHEPLVLVASDIAEAERTARTQRPALTSRERQILELGCAGLTSRQIASILQVSVRTVDAHLRDAYRRLGVTSRMSAVEKARREGLIS
jgi:DNA-binding NarL/FixJ family response regulator